eukprot:c17560_g2_i1 orf=168-371(+)
MIDQLSSAHRRCKNTENDSEISRENTQPAREMQTKLSEFHFTPFHFISFGHQRSQKSSSPKKRKSFR